MSSMKPMARAAREPRGPALIVFTRTLYCEKGVRERAASGAHLRDAGGVAMALVRATE